MNYFNLLNLLDHVIPFILSSFSVFLVNLYPYFALLEEGTWLKPSIVALPCLKICFYYELYLRDVLFSLLWLFCQWTSCFARCSFLQSELNEFALSIRRLLVLFRLLQCMLAKDLVPRLARVSSVIYSKLRLMKYLFILTRAVDCFSVTFLSTKAVC